MLSEYPSAIGDKRNHWLTVTGCLLPACLAGLIIAIMSEANAVGIAGLSFFLFILLCFTFNQPYPELRRVLVVAFALRAGLALIHSFGVALPDSQFDASGFEQTGWQLAQGWKAGMPFELVTGSRLYPTVIGLVYYVLDRSPLLIQGINVLFGTFVVYNVGAITRLLFNSKVAVIASWMACLFPALLLYSAITMREVAVVFPFSLFVLFFVRWLKGDRIIHLLGSITFLYISSLFHIGVSFLMILPGLFLIYKIYEAILKGRAGSLIIKIIAGCLLLIMLAVPVMTGAGMEKIRDLSSMTDIDYLAFRHEKQSIDRAAYLQDLTMSSPGNLVYAVPLKILYFLFAPFPWQIEALIDITGTIDGLFYFVLIILAFRGLSRIRQEHGKLVFWGIAATLAAGIVVFAMGTANYGTALRHRAKFAFIIITLAGPALHYYLSQRFLVKKRVRPSCRLWRHHQKDEKVTRRPGGFPE